MQEEPRPYVGEALPEVRGQFPPGLTVFDRRRDVVGEVADQFEHFECSDFHGEYVCGGPHISLRGHNIMSVMMWV